MPKLSRRSGGAVAALLIAAVLAGCSSTTTGTALSAPGSTTSSAPAPTTSAATTRPRTSPSKPAPSSSSPGSAGSVQPVTVSEFLTAKEAGHPVATSKVTDPTSPATTSSPFGCLDVTPLLASDPTLKAAPFGITARDQTYKSGAANDATFLFEAVINTPAPENAALIARVLGKALAKCTRPKLILFQTPFTATRSAVGRPVGCDSGTQSLTVALGHPAGTDPNRPLGVEVDSYVVQVGTRFAYALNFYPLIQGTGLNGALLATKMCAHLR